MQPLPPLPTPDTGFPVAIFETRKLTGIDGRLHSMISEILSTVQRQEMQKREISEQLDQLNKTVWQLPERIYVYGKIDGDSNISGPMSSHGDIIIKPVTASTAIIEDAKNDVVADVLKPESYLSVSDAYITQKTDTKAEIALLSRRQQLAKINFKRTETLGGISVGFEDIPFLREGKGAWLTGVTRWIVHSTAFEYATSSVIILNSILIGIRIQYELKGLSGTAFGKVVQGSELFFLGIYTLELLMRFFSDGKAAFYNPWIAFDAFLVLCGLISECIIEPIKANNTTEGMDILKKLVIFRVLRIMRLLRPLRLISHFQIIWRLVSGLFSSGGTILSTLALLAVTIYIAACLGIEFITHDENLSKSEPTQQIVEFYFSDLPTTMLTLFQFVTLDSISVIYFELIKKQPFLILYFVALVLIMSISLMNLVTAVLVEAGIEGRRKDEELALHAKRQKMGTLEPEVRKAFGDMDINGDRSLTMEEVLASYIKLPQTAIDLVKPDSLLELFEMLDEDESGEVSESEFVDGLLNAACSEIPLEMQHVLEMLRNNRRALRKVDKDLHGIKHTIKTIAAKQ